MIAAVQALTVQLPTEGPFDGDDVLAFLGTRAVTGVEAYDGTTYRRSLRLPRGTGTVALQAGRDSATATIRLTDRADLDAAVALCRRLLDLDAAPAAVSAALGADPALSASVAAHPGLRSPGAVDGCEIAVRAVLGQQVSVAAARTAASRLVAAVGAPLDPHLADDEVTHLFPDAAAVAATPDAALAMPASRRRAVLGIGVAVASGVVVLDPATEPAPDPVAARQALLALKGIGPWTADYIAMRVLGDRDAFLPTDLGVLAGARALGLPASPAALATHAERWRPYRAYAVHHLWRHAAGGG